MAGFSRYIVPNSSDSVQGAGEVRIRFSWLGYQDECMIVTGTSGVEWYLQGDGIVWHINDFPGVLVALRCSSSIAKSVRVPINSKLPYNQKKLRYIIDIVSPLKVDVIL